MSTSMMSGIGVPRNRAADLARRLLRRAPSLRSAMYLSIELSRLLREPCADPAMWESQYALRDGAWRYETNPEEQRFFACLLELLGRAGPRFGRALEVGSGDGNFTCVLAPLCDTVDSVDVSHNALARARTRQAWPSSVRFSLRDVRTDPVSGPFDLVVVSCVLETVHRPWLLTRIRDKLVAALAPGGHVLVATTRSHPVVEDAWWGRRLLRGKWIARHFGEHPALEARGVLEAPDYAFGLLRKQPS
jgi:protein-L-isoaspartate O-methyltransferase